MGIEVVRLELGGERTDGLRELGKAMRGLMGIDRRPLQILWL
jgi:hypothetical protein